jgi:phosphoribosylanthranilate isomerase
MAIDIVKPQVVDVSSGVEKEGRKDLEKIEKFMRSVKNEF